MAVPGAPAKPAAKSSKGSVVLSWRPASANGAAVTYTIQIQVKKKWKTVAVTKGTSWKGKLKGVKKGAKVTLRIVPKNSAGSGKPSAAFRVKVK